jgi:hypothetical protein
MNIFKPTNEGTNVISKTNMFQQRSNAYEFYCSDCLNKFYFALKRVFVFSDLLTTTSAQAVVRLARRIHISYYPYRIHEFRIHLHGGSLDATWRACSA